MPCSSSAGVRLRSCSSKLSPGSFSKATQNMVLVHNLEQHNFFFRCMEEVYDKCAGFNLRYCPLRVTVRRDKCFSSTIQDLIILLCFLFANSVVFLNIITKMAVHIFYLLKETLFWIKSRSGLNSECSEPLYFEPKLKGIEYIPGKLKQLDKILENSSY